MSGIASFLLVFVMDEVKLYKLFSNFYYFLIVAIKIRESHMPFSSASDKRRFIINWLNKAKENKIFNKVVISDINWLLREVACISLKDFESRLLYIHRVSYSIFERKLAFRNGFVE
ncbi:TPA: hypothetical protein ACP4QZ_005854 [Klebsiella variicola]